MTKTKNTQVSKIKLNTNFIDFVERVITQKLMTKDKESLKKIYMETVKLKTATNVHRGSERTKREVWRTALDKALKARNISFKQYDLVSSDIVTKIRNKKSNYVEVAAE